MSRVLLYTRDGCHLCEEAAGLLDGWGVGYETAWDDRYVLRIPVIEVDGVVVAEAPIDPRALRRALKQLL
ncbi:MAG: glutaredoxin family protein [Actinomycetota bacterium]